MLFSKKRDGTGWVELWLHEYRGVCMYIYRKGLLINFTSQKRDAICHGCLKYGNRRYWHFKACLLVTSEGKYY